MADTQADVNADPVLAELASDDTQETSASESSTEETKTPEVAEDEQKGSEDVPVEESEPASETKDEPEASDESTDTKEEGQPQGKAEERKQQLNEEIRDLVSRRNALRTEVEQINNQVYQVASEDELVADGMSRVEAKVEAMRQERELERFNNQVAEAQLTLETESSRVLQDFPIFNPESESYNEQVAQRAAAVLAKSLVQDPNSGQIISSNVSPYELYQTIAEAHESAAVANQIKGQKATEKMLASADVSTSTAPPKEKKDPILSILSSDD